jgi:hypothetical protein
MERNFFLSYILTKKEVYEQKNLLFNERMKIAKNSE